jgi:GGDEF domain-containing protein
MIDIDDFKPFNDRFGHPRDDMLLKRLSVAIKRSTREGVDVVARHGGEEFVVTVGVAGHPDLGEAECVPANADEALYLTKRLAKNHAEICR